MENAESQSFVVYVTERGVDVQLPSTNILWGFSVVGDFLEEQFSVCEKVAFLDRLTLFMSRKIVWLEGIAPADWFEVACSEELEAGCSFLVRGINEPSYV